MDSDDDDSSLDFMEDFNNFRIDDREYEDGKLLSINYEEV